MIAIRTLTTIFTAIIGLCGILPLFSWLTTFPRMILVVGLVFGIWQDYAGRWPVKPWMQNCAIVPVFLYYALQFSPENPLQPVISVLAIMLAVRLSGEKTVRHSIQISALSLFCLASSSLFDLSPVFLVYLALLLFLVAISLVLLTFQSLDGSMTVSGIDLKKILVSGVLMPILAIPLLLLLFPIMPRTQMPLWNFLAPPVTRTSGFSTSVEPGSQSSIAEDKRLAFRAEMPRQSSQQLFWRGTVFNRTDGSRWTRITQIPVEHTVTQGPTVTQSIYPEPTASLTLIALDRPAALSLYRVKRSPDGVYELIGGARTRLSYSASSLPKSGTDQRNSIDRSFYLQLPDQLPDRVKNLAGKIIHSGTTDRARVTFLEDYFRNGNYRYSMRNLATGPDAMEQFIFEKKLGHCEFFASSFALLLRAAGVPCRLVGGYLGGEYNQLGGYYLVTDANAHVWVEAFIEGSGWLRIDPSGFAANAGEVWTAPGARSLKHRIALALDSFNHSWNRSVITYDFTQQVKVVSQVGLKIQSINVSSIIRSFLGILVVAGLLVGLLYAVHTLHFFRSREQRILLRFLRMADREFGLSSMGGTVGLFEIASQAGNSHVSQFVTIYAGAVYHDRTLTDNEYGHLQEILRTLAGVGSKIS